MCSQAKILVAYFSCTGTTEKVANAIVEVTGGKPYKITPADPYTSADLNWKDKNSRSSREMSDEQSRPVLSGDVLNVKDYDIVFLGYPIWWNLCRVRLIHLLRNMISLVRPSFHLLLREVVR